MDGEQGPEVASRAAVGVTVTDMIRALADMRPAADSAGMIDQLRELEDWKSAAAALQARITVAFDVRQRRDQASAGVPAEELGTGIAAQIALARRESPAKGSRLLGLAKALVTEMPHTLAGLETGQLNEWRATLLVRETACLSAADRSAVDEELASDAGRFSGAGDRAVIAAVRAAAYRRDPRSVADRASHAAAERHVSLRPAPDTMCYLTAFLPVAEGVAVHAALTKHADTSRSDGDPRSRGQLMADALVERTTGTAGGISGIEIQLVMTDRTLLQGDSEPARLPGYGVVPGGWAREIAVPDQDRPDEHLAPAALHRPGHRRSGGDGIESKALPARTAPLCSSPGPDVPYAVLRRPDQATGPCPPLAQRRNDDAEQRRRTLRSLQPHQGSTRVERPPPAGAPAHDPTDNAHWAQLPVHRPAVTWASAS